VVTSGFVCALIQAPSLMPAAGYEVETAAAPVHRTATILVI
jgi:hypothetical protein